VILSEAVSECFVSLNRTGPVAHSVQQSEQPTLRFLVVRRQLGRPARPIGGERRIASVEVAFGELPGRARGARPESRALRIHPTLEVWRRVGDEHAFE
jgi:hypothetical protein